MPNFMLYRKQQRPSSLLPSPHAAEFSSALTTKLQPILSSLTRIITNSRGVRSKPQHNYDYWAGRSAQFGALCIVESQEMYTQIHSQKWEPHFRPHANTRSPPRFGYRRRHELSFYSAGNRNCHFLTPHSPFQPTCGELTGQIRVPSGVSSAIDHLPTHTRIKLLTHALADRTSTPLTTSHETVPFLRSGAPRCSS